MSRLGAILAPFVAVDLGQSGHLHVAEALITASCILAAASAIGLPYETAGHSLQVSVHHIGMHFSLARGTKILQIAASIFIALT